MKVLQLGKFYPIKGGVEKVEYDLMTGLSAHGIDCDMLCATVKGKDEKRGRHGRIIFCPTWKEIAGTMHHTPFSSLWRTVPPCPPRPRLTITDCA